MTLDTELGYPAGASAQTGSEVHPKNKQNELRGLSPRANNIDRTPPLIGEVSANFCG
jgi:hypothetical protein